MLRTAVDLKEAIEKAPTVLQSMGTCPLVAYDWKEDNGFLDEDNDQTNRTKLISEKIGDIVSTLEDKYFTETKITDGEITIDFNGISYSGNLKDITQEKLKELFDAAPQAPFGDQKNLKTVVNTEVRNAKDITSEYFKVSQTVIDQITNSWSRGGMYPSSVIVEPYKINLYGQGGHFELHQDTPSKDMVGTALIALSNGYGGYLELIKDENHTNTWYQCPGDCISFFTDVPHRATEVYQNGIRATIAFKIYYKDNYSGITKFDSRFDGLTDVEKIKHLEIELGLGKNLAEKIIEFKKVAGDQKFGFLFGHSYSVHASSLKGSDAALVGVLTMLGYKFTILPVIHKVYIHSFHDGQDDILESNVYPLTDAHIDYILNRGTKPNEDFSDINFYSVKWTDYAWKNEHQDFVEFCGNESRPEEENSIYLSRAIIFH